MATTEDLLKLDSFSTIIASLNTLYGQVEATYDNFDDRYLGSKASDPSTDNDGDALIEGAIYWNSTNDVLKVYDGSSWLSPVELAGAAQTAAEAAQTAAETAEANAETAESNAETSASNAATSETNAGDSATAANAAQAAAETAQTGAETAEANAETAQTAAETARDKAQDWAEEDEDVEVEAGEYSAKHHALKAAEQALLALQGIKFDDRVDTQANLPAPPTEGHAAVYYIEDSNSGAVYNSNTTSWDIFSMGSITVENVLTSSSTTNALSAAQGKHLEDNKAERIEIAIPVDDISSMKALNPAVFQKAMVSGFYAGGEFEGHVKYTWNASGNKSDHDGWSIINPDHLSTIGSEGWYSSTGDSTNDSGTGVWERAIPDSLWVEELGAKGDDNTHNNAFAFYALSDHIIDSGGHCSIFFHCKEYHTLPTQAGSAGSLFKIDAPNVSIFGNGASIVIDETTAISFRVFSWNTDQVYRKNYWLSDINIINNRVWEDEQDQRGSQFLTFEAGENFHIQDVVGYHPEQYGIQLREVADSDLRDIWLTRVKMDYVSRAGTNGFIALETLANTDGTGITENLFVHNCYFRTKDPEGYTLTNLGTGAVMKLQAVHNAHFTKTQFLDEKGVANIAVISPGRDTTDSDKMSTEIYFSDCIVSNHDHAIHTGDLTDNDVEVVIEFDNVTALSDTNRFVIASNVTGVKFSNCNKCGYIGHTNQATNRVPKNWKFINCEFTRPAADMLLSIAESEFRDCTFVDANQVAYDSAYDCHGNKFIDCDFENIRINMSQSANTPTSREDGTKYLRCTFDNSQLDRVLAYSMIDDAYTKNHEVPVAIPDSSVTIINSRIELPYTGTFASRPILFHSTDGIFSGNKIYQPAGDSRSSVGDVFSDSSVIYDDNTIDCNYTSINAGTIPNTTWAPVDGSGAGLSLTVDSAIYMKSGMQVTVGFDITFPSTADGSTATIAGLPLPHSNEFHWIGACTSDNAYNLSVTVPSASDDRGITFRDGDGNVTSNDDLSGARIRGTITYLEK